MKKKILKIFAAITLASTFSIAFADENKNEAEFYAATDAATTIIGLSQGAVETNPMGPVASIILKPVVLNVINDFPESERKQSFNAVSSVWGAATANNLCVITGGTSCVVVGLVYGAILWVKNSD